MGVGGRICSWRGDSIFDLATVHVVTPKIGHQSLFVTVLHILRGDLALTYQIGGRLRGRLVACKPCSSLPNSTVHSRLLSPSLMVMDHTIKFMNHQCPNRSSTYYSSVKLQKRIFVFSYPLYNFEGEVDFQGNPGTSFLNYEMWLMPWQARNVENVS